MNAHSLQDELTIKNADAPRAFITAQYSYLLGEKQTKAISIQVIKYQSDYYKDRLFTDFDINKAEQISTWLPKRKAQFLAGRLAAKNSLQSITTHNKLIHIPLRTGKHKEPIWPENIIGSISHSDDISIAIAHQKKPSTLGVGIDIQTLINDDDCIRNTPTVLNQSEKKFFQLEDIKLTRNQIFTLIFSAKESFFKAAFNSVKDYFNFDDIAVTDINIETQTLTLKCETTLNQDFIKNSQHTITFEYIKFDTPAFITYCYLKSTD